MLENALYPILPSVNRHLNCRALLALSVVSVEVEAMVWTGAMRVGHAYLYHYMMSFCNETGFWR